MNTLSTVAFGSRATLTTVTDSRVAAQVAASLRNALGPLAASVVPGADTVAVRFNDAATGDLPSLVEQALNEAGDSPLPQPRTHLVPVTYDGEDLHEVATALGVSVGEVVARHSEPVYTVDFLGFAPGFPYLSGLDPFLAEVARRETPRPRLAAGCVGLAAGMTCIYPTASPGGWQILGRTETVLFDAASASPALMQPGDQVRFEAVR